MICTRIAVLLATLITIDINLYAGEPMLSITGPSVDESGYFLTVSLYNAQDVPLVVDSTLRLGLDVRVFRADGNLIDLMPIQNSKPKQLHLRQTMLQLPPGWRTERRLYFDLPIDSLVVAESSDANGNLTGLHCYYSQFSLPSIHDVSKVEVRLEYTGAALTAATSVLGRQIEEKLYRGSVQADWTKRTRALPTPLKVDSE